jgi:hypothetical protein
MTLTVKLADVEQSRLEVIIAVLHSENQSEAVRTLINEKFETLRADKTLFERRGGHPKYLLNGVSNLSDRKNRKSVIEQGFAAKATRRAR